MRKIIPYVFFIAWLLCGCSLETMFEKPEYSVIPALALIVAIACAYVIGSNND